MAEILEEEQIEEQSVVELSVSCSNLVSGLGFFSFLLFSLFPLFLSLGSLL